MNSVNYDELTENLPDVFAKDSESNNYKILMLNKVSSDKIIQDINIIFDMLNINNAYGAVLDDIYGELLRRKRGAANDEQYMIQLKGKMTQNISDGTFPMIIEALAYIAQCDESEVHIVEQENKNAVTLKSIPMTVLDKAGFSVGQVIDIVSALVPTNVAVSVGEDAFSGTFEFAEFDDEYDEERGFADIQQTIGGYFGMII